MSSDPPPEPAAPISGVPSTGEGDTAFRGESTVDRVRQGFDRVLSFSADHRFEGYSKFDALNSPAVESLLGWNRWTRLLVTQLVNRSYWHLRPILGVRKSRNPKGIANFIRAFSNAHVLFGRDADRETAIELGDWLIEHSARKSGDFSGHCWGYNFPWHAAIDALRGVRCRRTEKEHESCSSRRSHRGQRSR